MKLNQLPDQFDKFYYLSLWLNRNRYTSDCYYIICTVVNRLHSRTSSSRSRSSGPGRRTGNTGNYATPWRPANSWARFRPGGTPRPAAAAVHSKRRSQPAAAAQSPISDPLRGNCVARLIRNRRAPIIFIESIAMNSGAANGLQKKFSHFRLIDMQMCVSRQIEYYYK